jgi:hypothetical protein
MFRIMAGPAGGVSAMLDHSFMQGGWAENAGEGSVM